MIHQKNKGVAAARNAGIDWIFANSDSQWISFVDGDDWIHPEYLQYLFSVANESGLKVSVCSFVKAGESKESAIVSDDTVQLRTSENFYIKEYANAVVPWGKLYHKSCFMEIRYPVGRINEDAFTTHKILFSLDQIAVTGQKLYFYNDRPGSIMRSPFSIRNYDDLIAREERITYFTMKGYSEVVEFEKRGLQYKTAEFAVRARKTGFYNQVPARFRMSWIKAMRTIRESLCEDQYEWVMFQCYPCLIRIRAYCHKMLRVAKMRRR